MASPSLNEVLLLGDVIVTFGAAFTISETTAVTIDDVVVAPSLSVAIAVNE